MRNYGDHKHIALQPGWSTCNANSVGWKLKYESKYFGSFFPAPNLHISLHSVRKICSIRDLPSTWRWSFLKRTDCNNNASRKFGDSSPHWPLLTEDLIAFFLPRKFRMRSTNLCPTATSITPSHSSACSSICPKINWLLSRMPIIYETRESRALRQSRSSPATLFELDSNLCEVQLRIGREVECFHSKPFKLENLKTCDVEIQRDSNGRGLRLRQTKVCRVLSS